MLERMQPEDYEKSARLLRRFEIRSVHWARHSAVAASVGVVVVGRRGHALAVGLTWASIFAKKAARELLPPPRPQPW